MACVYCMACVARQTTFFLFPILIIPVLDMQSPQRDPRPPTLPTTIHAGPDSMHAETDYHLPILRMDTLLISPELRILRHPTISRHHPSLPFLTLSRYAHTGCPYLAVSRHLCPITTRREKRQKDSKMSHPLYTKLPHFALFVSKFYFGPYFTH